MDGGFKRTDTRPTVEAAVIYCPASGMLTVVARGGRAVHEAIQRAFARFMLAAPAGTAMANQSGYRLDRLVPARPLPPLPGTGVVAARVRRLGLRPLAGGGELIVNAPPGRRDQSVFDMSEQWFPGGARLLERFTVSSATITMHYEVSPNARRSKAINIEMSHSGTSNVKRLPRPFRSDAEAHLTAWGLTPK